MRGWSRDADAMRCVGWCGSGRAVVTRAEGMGIEVVTGSHETFEFTPDVSGALVQYPATDGRVLDYSGFAAQDKEAGAKLAVPTHLLQP